MFVSEDYRQFTDDVWPWVDIVVSSLVPFVLIIASNVVLVKRVRQSMREARQTLATGSTNQLKARENQASSMTLTLVCVSLAFVLLTSPICVYAIMRPTGRSDGIPDVNQAAQNHLTEAIANVLWLANIAINFYIYALTGSRYRAAMARVCGCHEPKKVTSVTRSTSVTQSSDFSAAQL